MKKIIAIEDKQFELFIEQELIEQEIRRIAERMNAELKGKKPVFIVVLNGAFMFAAELMKQISLPSEITFVRLASYIGTSSSDDVKKIFGLNESIRGRNVVIVEDIVDSGNTLTILIEELKKLKPQEIKIATMLFKPAAQRRKINPDYVAMEIPNDFVVGYGLDYGGQGRNLNNIYRIK